MQSDVDKLQIVICELIEEVNIRLRKVVINFQTIIFYFLLKEVFHLRILV